MSRFNNALTIRPTFILKHNFSHATVDLIDRIFFKKKITNGFKRTIHTDFQQPVGFPAAIAHRKGIDNREGFAAKSDFAEASGHSCNPHDGIG